MEVVNLCDCLQKLSLINKIKKYESVNLSNYISREVEEGELCLVFDRLVDIGNYDDNFNWNSFFVNEEELYPIEYCPICGKKIEYRKELKLEKNI